MTTIEDLQKICHTLPQVVEDIKWETHLCFNVAKKMFLITSPDSFPPTASFKVSDEDFESLSVRSGFKPAPHLARYKWIYISNIDLFTRKQWEYYIRQSYELVVAKLPAKTRKLLQKK